MVMFSRSLGSAILLAAGAQGARISRKRASEAAPTTKITRPLGGVFPKAQDSARPEGILPNIEDFAACHLSASECRLEDMTEATLVYTDDNSSLCWNGDPWAFLVHPGNSGKVLMYFTGGGGCWENSKNGSSEVCFNSLKQGVRASAYGRGLMNFNNPKNKFKDYTFVALPSCDGGAFVSNTKRDVPAGGYQLGHNNVAFAKQWVQHNIGDEVLESFVLAGSSAGALGVSVWSDSMLDTFRYKKASVMMDSYIGVFPSGTQGVVLKTWGVCQTSLWESFPQNIQEDCLNGRGNIYDVLDRTIKRHSNVAFAHVQPKVDAVQRGFYAAIALSYQQKPNVVLSGPKLYTAANKIMERYNKHPNYIVYYSGGSTHCFMIFPWWYRTTIVGPFNARKPRGTHVLADWAWKVANHEEVGSECDGARRSNDWGGFLYCDKVLFPKKLQL